jgi:hypothetical protein
MKRGIRDAFGDAKSRDLPGAPRKSEVRAGRVMALISQLRGAGWYAIFASGSVRAQQKASATHAMDWGRFSNAQAVVATSQAVAARPYDLRKALFSGITDSANRN